MAISSDIDVINAALTRVGQDPITSLQQAGSGAAIASANYEQIVEDALSTYPWRWASKIERLNMLDPAAHGDPPPPWAESWQFPSSYPKLRKIEVGGLPIKYDLASDKIFASQGVDAVLLAFVTWRPPEANWPGWFREYIIQKLEAVFLRGIGERFDEGNSRDEFARKVTLPEAKRLDAQSKPPTDPFVSGTLRARRA